jgi:hypothetical protein
MIMNKKDQFIKVLIDTEATESTDEEKPLKSFRIFDEERK